MDDGEQDQRGREGAQEAQDQPAGHREQGGTLSEEGPGEEPQDERADNPSIKRYPMPPGQEPLSRFAGLMLNGGSHIGHRTHLISGSLIPSYGGAAPRVPTRGFFA